MSDNKLWAVHVQGPDDVHACESREVAEATANALNKMIDHVSSPMSPICRATVIEWPYTKEEWLKELQNMPEVQG